MLVGVAGGEYSLFSNRLRLSRINFSINYLRLRLALLVRLNHQLQQWSHSFVGRLSQVLYSGRCTQQTFWNIGTSDTFHSQSQTLQHDTGETGKKCICVTVEIQNIVKPWKYTYSISLKMPWAKGIKRVQSTYRTLSLRFSHWLFNSFSNMFNFVAFTWPYKNKALQWRTSSYG